MPDTKPTTTEPPSEPWEKAELELRAEQIAELHLTDPLAAEEMLERGELDDADDGPADDE